MDNKVSRGSWSTDSASGLTRGSLLARNVVYNIVGQLVPVVFAIVSIPILIRTLGVDKFGIFTIVWMVVGYFSLFDLGVGRALTKFVAERLGGDGQGSIGGLVSTALSLSIGLGLLGAVVAALNAHWLAYQVLKVPSGLRHETESVLYLLAFSIPVVTSTGVLRGVLEALQRFELLNYIRVPVSAFNYLSPLVVLPFSHSLLVLTLVLVIGRVIAWAIYLMLCISVVPSLFRSWGIVKSVVKPLVAYGGWLTVTNVVGPVLVYADRFMIGAMLSMAAVAYYTTPFELTTKLLFIPTGLTGVFFPAFATAFAKDMAKAAGLFGRGVRHVFLLMFPPVLILTVMAHAGLSLWLGTRFADKSSEVLQLLSAGVLINSLAQVPFTFLQGVGRADITAKLHMLETVMYLPLLWYLITVAGITGAAIAWVLRVTADAIAMLYAVSRVVPEAKKHIREAGWVVLISVIVLTTDLLLSRTMFNWLYFVVVSCAFLSVGWKIMLKSDEKRLIHDRLKLLMIR